MRVLVLDSAVTRHTAALVVDGEVLRVRSEDRGERKDAALPAMAREVLGDRDDRPGLDCIAVTIGPGSFTGIRAGLALAHGLGAGLGVDVIGVTVGEAIADSFPHLGERILWVVTASRRGHIFLERTDGVLSLAVDALPAPPAKVAIAGGAALQVAARLAAIGANVMLTDARFPQARHIAAVAARRMAGTLTPREARPLYVDPAQAGLPAGGLRPPPSAAGP